MSWVHEKLFDLVKDLDGYCEELQLLGQEVELDEEEMRLKLEGIKELVNGFLVNIKR